ncbi:MAG: hypothetical protein H6737_23160 [Alphaproteobacteria bacterium]|nr:hypothetical protein [Alphaproteobacteria bacterium]
MRLPVLALLFLSLARAGGSSLALPDAADITTPGDIAGLSKSDEVVFRKLENDFRSAGFSSVTFPNNTTVHLGIPSGPFSELRLQVSGNVDRKARYHSYTAIVREPRPWAEILGDTGENPHAVGFSADGHRVWRVGDVYVAADPNGDGILVPAWVSSNRNVVALTLDRLRSTMATAVEAGDVRGADAVLRVLLAFGYQEAAADVERFDALLWKRCPAGLDAVATRARRATTADEALRALRAAVDIALERCVVDGVLRKDAAKSLVALAGDLPSEARALRGLAAGDSFDAEGLERLRSELTGLTRPTMSDSDWAASAWDARVDALADAQVAFARGTDRERAELQPWLEARTTELAATLSAEADAARGRNEVVTGALLDAAVRRMRGEPVETVALGGSTAGSRLREALFAADGEFVARALEQSAVAVAGFRLDGLPTTPRATLAAGAVTGEIKGPTEASRTVPHTYAKLTTIENPALFEHEVRVRELRRQLDQTREAERSLRNAVVQTKFVAGQTTYSQELTTRVAETQKVYNTYDYQLVARTTPARWETTVNHDNAARADVLKAEATRREAELAAMKPPPARIESRVPTTVPLEEKVQRWSGQRARTLSIAVEGATTTREQVFDA